MNAQLDAEMERKRDKIRNKGRYAYLTLFCSSGQRDRIGGKV